MGGLTLLGDFVDDSPEVAQDSKYSAFKENLDVRKDINETSNSLQEKLTNIDSTEFGIFGVLNALINGAWNTLKLLINNLSFMTGAMASAVSIFGLPSWVSGTVIMLVTILIAFSIYSAIFQRDI
jgi:hypothetical protein